VSKHHVKNLHHNLLNLCGRQRPVNTAFIIDSTLSNKNPALNDINEKHPLINLMIKGCPAEPQFTATANQTRRRRGFSHQQRKKRSFLKTKITGKDYNNIK